MNKRRAKEFIQTTLVLSLALVLAFGAIAWYVAFGY